jgi:hypothetical protein
MAYTQTLDRTGWELQQSAGGGIGPWRRSVLYRVTLAVQAADAADTDDEARRLVLDAIDAVGEREPLRKALEHAGVDVRAVETHLRAINDEWQRHRDAVELEQWQRWTREEDRRNGRLR